MKINAVSEVYRENKIISAVRVKGEGKQVIMCGRSCSLIITKSFPAKLKQSCQAPIVEQLFQISRRKHLTFAIRRHFGSLGA